MISHCLLQQLGPILLFILSLSDFKLHHVVAFSPPLCGVTHGRFAPCPNRLHRYATPLTSHRQRRLRNKRSDDETEDNLNDKNDFILEQIDPLEIRLDATLLSIYVLCRFLFYDVTTGVKQTPGWELHDVIMILQTFSSAIVLSVLWTLVGVYVTGIFRYDNSIDDEWEKPLVTTTIIAAPLWIATEVVFGWPTAGVFWLESTGGNRGLGGVFLGTQELSLIVTLMGAGTLGVGFIMILGRYLRKFIA